jgi:hypothetical protein
MINHSTTRLLLLSCLASSWSLMLAASEIYHWVDADGVSHYSQSPPTDTANTAETLQVDGSQPSSYDPEEDRYNVKAQAESTQAVYDKLAENRKNKQAQQNSVENTVIYYPQNEDYDNILYPPSYWNNLPNRPGNGPRPPNRPVQPLPPDFLPSVPARPIRPGRP